MGKNEKVKGKDEVVVLANECVETILVKIIQRFATEADNAHREFTNSFIMGIPPIKEAKLRQREIDLREASESWRIYTDRSES